MSTDLDASEFHHQTVITIPLFAIQDVNLNTRPLLMVFSYLYFHNAHIKAISVQNKLLASWLMVNEKTISKVFSKLEKLNYIQRYTVIIPESQHAYCEHRRMIKIIKLF